MDRLSGGTFFVLLSDARKDMLSASENYKGNRSGISEVALLAKLALLANPEIIITDADIKSNRTLQNNTNDFKAGRNWGGTTFQLHTKETIASFKKRFHNKYSDLVGEMAELIDTFINVKKDTVLVRALMELIISDENIPTEQEFNIGWIVLKQELRNTTDVSLPSFILGIWYYLLIHIDDNKIGSETYEKWCPRNNQGKREYQGTLGEDSTLEITVTRPAITHISRTEKAAISDTNENKQSEISLPVPHEVPPEALEDIPYNADDIELLREFNTDYDAIIMKCIGDNFAMFWLEGQLSVQIRTLFEGKWKERSSLFYDLSLHSNILAMLDYLQKLCDILDPNTNNHDITAFKPSVREIRRKMRNCYIKLHPYEYIGGFPYETGIADWMEGEE